jgi:hypothetical protein
VVNSYQCPTDYTATNGFLQREGFRYARSSYVACFGPADLDVTPEDDRGMFRRNSRVRFTINACPNVSKKRFAVVVAVWFRVLVIHRTSLSDGATL